MANEMRVENWDGNDIRFVYLTDKEEWYAIGKDVAKALGYRDTINALKKTR